MNKIPKKLKPCWKCGSSDLNRGDCGYSSFNICWVKCNHCGYEVKGGGDDMGLMWNKDRKINEKRVVSLRAEADLLEAILNQGFGLKEANAT